MIASFTYKYRFLSNFHPSRIVYERISYPTVEHAYQAAKSNDPKFREMISKIPVNKAGKAKREGRKVRLRPEWDDVFCVEVMEELLRLKFEDKKLKQKLLDTGDKKLIEGNYWHDNFYGDCNCSNCEDTFGYNVLGKLLMKLRKEYNESINNWRSS
jgi:ribA/ribD-fused uncharacterized protein